MDLTSESTEPDFGMRSQDAAALPPCPSCGLASGWTGVFRFQTERLWEVTPENLDPRLLDEDDDFGEWDDIACRACGKSVPLELRDTLLGFLTGGAPDPSKD